ncbi:hypothetical protein M758_6G046100 [Ceratodon purpureus]|nr:hypothetical protein M758_6G046100 [Ceratodon purpureus]
MRKSDLFLCVVSVRESQRVLYCCRPAGCVVHVEDPKGRGFWTSDCLRCCRQVLFGEVIVLWIRGNQGGGCRASSFLIAEV